MAIKPSTSGKLPRVDPAPIRDVPTRTMWAAQRGAAASLAGGIIAASGRPHTLAEAMKVLAEVHYAMFPSQENPGYQEWMKDPDRLTTPYR